MNHTDKKPTSKHIWLLVPIVIIAAGFVADSIDAARGEQTSVFSIPGFWAAFGLLGSLGLAGVCKLVARLFLKRPENYYDDVL